MSQIPPMPPTFLEKLSSRIAALKKPSHRFVIVSSGTAFQINKEIVAKYPPEHRGEVNRSLLYEWQEGKQTLMGMKAIIRDQILIYKKGRAEQIAVWLKDDVDLTTQYAIVPDEAFDQLNAHIQFSFLKEDQCLFLD